MTTFTEPTAPSPDPHALPTGEAVSPVDAQRAALRDLVSLATESAATEARIDRDLQAALKQADETYHAATQTIRARFELQAGQATQKYNAQLEQIRQRQAADAQAIRQFEEPSRQEANAAFEQTQQLVNKKIQEATWLADSDLEVTINALAADKKRIEAEVAAELAALDGARRSALQQAVTYGYRAGDADLVTPPEITADTAPAATEAAPIPAGPADPAEAFAAHRTAMDQAAAQLTALKLPRLFVGVMPFVVLLFAAAVAGGATWLITGIDRPNYVLIGSGAGGMAVLVLLIGLTLRGAARRSVTTAFGAVTDQYAAARAAAARRLSEAAAQREKARGRATHKRETEIRFAREKYTPGVANAKKKLDATLAAIAERAGQAREKSRAEIEAASAEVNAAYQKLAREIEQKQKLDLQGAKLFRDRQADTARDTYTRERSALETRLREGLATIRGPIAAAAETARVAPEDWEAPAWSSWKPTATFARSVQIGRLSVDLLRIARESGRAPAAGLANSADDQAIHLSHDLDIGFGTPWSPAPPADAHHTPAPPDDAVHTDVRLELPPPFDLPASLAFPRLASLLLQADRDGRAPAVRAVQMAMARLLVSLPAGRVRFTLLDPVGLGQNFAGFMHLADHDDQLVGGRIWTETDQIDQRLTDLTGHMETVIQKYLRNEFETIDDYNAQAGELAEPYRFLVVCDFPAKFTDEALRRLSSIATSGARCGVYTIILHDTRLPLPHGTTTLEDLSANSVTLEQVENRFVWRDDVFSQFPLRLDPPPSEAALTRILDKVGKAAKDAARVEVPFDTIAPKADQFWTLDSAGDVHVPVGRSGATRLQQLRLGKGVAQHVLIAGKTGSGKSTLLNAMVTNLAMWYPPEQVEFYLVDFKKGVEFKTYATHNLPHARAIAVESDREFGLSVLQKLDAELTRRGELFRAAGVQDLAAYRKSDNPQQLPRTLLIVDEFQEFFSEDDKLAQESSVLLDRLVRQGRAFGIHCLLGSQTIAGSGGLPRSTIGQMAVRIALMTSEADSQLILGDNNSAARLLSRPGEAIYNDQGGLVEGNSPFQVAWLSDERKDRYLEQIRDLADRRGTRLPPPIVFEGNAPADLAKNPRIADLLAGSQPPAGGLRAYVGEPVAIKEPTHIPLRRQSGANVLVIGQAEDAALATMLAALISLAAQVPPLAGEAPAASNNAAPPAPGETPGEALSPLLNIDSESSPAAAPIVAPRFYVFDATPADSALSGAFGRVKDALPRHDVRLVEWRATESAISEVATELSRRREAQDLSAAPVFLFVYGLQRYRVLRKSEDEFSFSLGSDAAKPADPGKQFAEILKDGPAHGIHVFTWADTATAIERTLDRGLMKEFDARVLFQMGANDSSNLIDSPAANKLGFHRGLVYSEEQGVMEKFRPYAVPTASLLEKLRSATGG